MMARKALDGSLGHRMPQPDAIERQMTKPPAELAATTTVSAGHPLSSISVAFLKSQLWGDVVGSHTHKKGLRRPVDCDRVWFIPPRTLRNARHCIRLRLYHHVRDAILQLDFLPLVPLSE